MILKYHKILISLRVIPIAFALSGCAFGNIEIPNYDVIDSNLKGNIELRRYDSLITAEVEVTGERKDAVSDGFRLLADYIFGNNSIKQDIAMTAPVQQQKENQTIAMTAPVQQQAEGDNWKISFVMPSKYTLDTLPTPNNNQINLITEPVKQFAVIQFSGTSSEANMSEHQKLLMEYIADSDFKPIGQPKYAFYDPPWILPFFRRNEIMLEIESK